MNGSCLLDTNIIVGLFIDDPSIARHFHQRSDIYLSVAVLGELFFGAQKSNRIDENMARIDQILEEATIIDHDIVTAYEYGTIRNELQW